MSAQRAWPAVLIASLLAQTALPLAAQAPAPVSLGTVRSLACAFTLMATGTWAGAAPEVETAKTSLTMQFTDIDAQDGTANVVNVSSASEGAPHIIVRLLADNLHFLAMNIAGSIYLTTVFGDREGRASGRLKAVHTRHEFTPVRMMGWTSRPEQYYGYCEAPE